MSRKHDTLIAPSLTFKAARYRIADVDGPCCASCTHRAHMLRIDKPALHWCAPVGACHDDHVCDCWRGY